MSFKLEKDVDFAWVTADFGSGSESYKITHYSLSLIIQLFKKYGHRKDGKTYANIGSIVPLPIGTPTLEAESEQIY